MDESTNTLLYTATYVFIFIIAVSLSIVLFLSVNRYADSAFDYKQGLNGSIINTGSTGLEEYQTGQVPLTKDDVFSYYVNYVEKDLYGTSSATQDVIYDISIKDKNNDKLEKDSDKLEKKSLYNDVYNQLADKYVLNYKSEGVKDNKKFVIIDITPFEEKEEKEEK